MVVLRPAARDLTPLLGPMRMRHGLGPTRDGGGVYPNLLHAEATLRLLGANPVILLPTDNRRLVENALHPEMLDAIARELGTAWTNHAARCAGIDHIGRQTGGDLSLDLSVPFRDLIFPEGAQGVGTRLGDQPILVDFDVPLPGPFGEAVMRIAVPHWMAGRVDPDDRPEPLGHDKDGWRFRLGEHHYVYGRWGLALAT